MRIRWFAVLVATGIATAAAPATAQDAAEVANGAPPAEATPPAERFKQAFATYKEAVVGFEALRTEFQSAPGDRREEINAELGRYYALLKQRVNAMVDAALAAYHQAPNTDQEVTDLLLSVAEHDSRGIGQNSQGGDNYERALTVVSALCDGGQALEHKQLPIYGIVAAFSTSNMEALDRFIKLADDVKAFDKAPNSKDEPAMAIFIDAGRYREMFAQEKQIWAAEKAVREAEAAADDLPRVLLKTTKGDVVIELFENEAPTAVANFLTLVKQEFYDGLFFHRVLPRFMAQGGDPLGTGAGGPGYSIACECYKPEARLHFRGSLSMAHAGRDTGGSQFFLTFVPTRHLDRKHTVFGRVIKGFEVLAELQRIEPGERGLTRDKIVSAQVQRDRGHGYEFEKLKGR
ncbi:MAG: peptidylprolyl isomerase [Planctomycetota bacterium]